MATNRRRLFFAACSAAPAIAQNWVFFGLFLQYSHAGSITKRLGYTVFLSATSHATFQQAESPGITLLDLQYYAQPNLTYTVTDNMQSGFGYACVRHNLFGIYQGQRKPVVAQTLLTHDLTNSRVRMSYRRFFLLLRREEQAH